MTGVHSIFLPRQHGWQQAAWLAAAVCTQLLLLLASAQSCPPAQQCPFRVLAIGDSLTKGAVPSKQLNHPYSIRLQALLNRKFNNRAKPNVTTAAYYYMGVFQNAQGDAGQSLDITLVPLMRSQLQQAKQQGVNYQWVVVMAGINDLGAGNRTAAAVMARLAEAYQLALASGANVLAIPPFPNRFVDRSSKNEQQRQQLAVLVRQWVAQQPAADCGQPRVYLQELPGFWFDFWSMPPERRAEMQDDMLHLTERGYDMLAWQIFNGISPRVTLQGCLCPARAGSSVSDSRRQGRL
ncbi:SGNH hydrolase-type esterase domain-containing protein [Scenedesmus sp. NREL 46B-D3]|nr:SGNH hydrolase-type esterase domain-containing protein [Scenedesmus sp. NREL 46B-D3]